MRSVSEIQIHSNSLKPGENNIHERKQVSFKASKIHILGEITERKYIKEGVQREVNKNTRKFVFEQAWFVRLSKYFSQDKFKGDIANVIITALGTGIVAPLMIKYNPLAKEDKDTKTYAAWRQPISAVITVITQVGITKQVEKIIKKMAAAGELGKEMNLKLASALLKIKELSSDVSDDLAVLAAQKDKKLSDYFNKKYGKLRKTAERLRKNGKFLDRAEMIERKAEEIKEFINSPEKGREYLLKKVEEYTAKSGSFEKEAKKITDTVSKYKDVVGIGIALITLPITCDILNRVYPWFMKWAFPELSNKKENKKIADINPSYAKEINPKAEEIRR